MARGERDGGERGQAAGELALVLPLLVLLLLAIAQVTLVARDQILVVHAARAGAREAAVSETPAQAPAAARRAVLEAGGLKSERTMTDMTRVGGSDTRHRARPLRGAHRRAARRTPPSGRPPRGTCDHAGRAVTVPEGRGRGRNGEVRWRMTAESDCATTPTC